jgi:hypothetical protein
MPFEKGRQKTGGRTKGGSGRKATKFVDQLSGAGFHYVKELADTLKGLKELRTTATDQKKDPDAYVKAIELKFFYNELKSLLPYMAPKLREKEVEVVEPTEDMPTESSISSEDLLNALNGKPETENHPRASDPNPLGAGRPELQVPSGTEENLSNLAGEQEEDA